LATNSTVFKLTNNGNYPAELEFAFLSAIIDNDPAYRKNVFSISIDKITIEESEQVKEIRVWAIPDEAKECKDELIIMIKNNPIPVVIPLRCLGSKPAI
jgi:hydrocephalus-inducing protein